MYNILECYNIKDVIALLANQRISAFFAWSILLWSSERACALQPISARAANSKEKVLAVLKDKMELLERYPIRVTKWKK